jgi:hypothetical protein
MYTLRSCTLMIVEQAHRHLLRALTTENEHGLPNKAQLIRAWFSLQREERRKAWLMALQGHDI